MKRRFKYDQSKTPLVDAVINYIGQNRLPFHMPGHERGGVIPEPLREWFGEKLFLWDLTEVQNMDYLHHAEGVIAEAMNLASDAFGVRDTKFLVNGTTVGVQAMMLSSVLPGEKIILQRNSHRSTVGGLILGSLEPIYINPEYNGDFREYTSVSTDTLGKVIKNHPTAKAVLLTTPNYFGLASDIQTLSSMASIKGLRVLVDEAHGAHFPFHPDLPVSAVECDVDLVTHSAHKTLPTLTQTSWLHVVTERAASERLLMYLTVLQSSSPSYIFMSALDACRRYMVEHGQEMLTQALEMADWLRDEVNKIPGLHSPGKEVVGKSGVVGFDRTKLTIRVSDIGLTGWEAERILNDEYNVEIELSDWDNILLFITVGAKWENVKALVPKLQHLASRKHVSPPIRRFSLPEIPPLEILPTKAAAAKAELVAINDAVGRVSANIVAPYPPGIPVLIHGEVITQNTVDFIKQVDESGALVQGLHENMLRVVK